MKLFSKLSILLLLIGSIASQTTELQAQDHDGMAAAAAALDNAFVAAFNSGDADKLATMYLDSPGLVSFPPDHLMDSGYDAVTGGWRAFLEATPGAKLEIQEPVQMIAGEYVVSYGIFKMTIPTPDGGMHEMQGRYTDVKTERDGKWVYVHDHASMPLPPPPPPKE